MPNKTVLFGMPPVSGLYKLVHDNLKDHGFCLIYLREIEENSHFYYPSFTSWLYTKWRKLVYKDASPKKHLKLQALQNNILERIKSENGLDYAFFINGETYSQDFIKFVRDQSKNGVVNYQFDGLHRFPKIYPLINSFDRFYVFDPDDLNTLNYQLLPATNFYFDHNLDNQLERTVDFYFTGVHMNSRVGVITSFGRYIKERKKTADINVLWRESGNGREIYPDDSITLIDQYIDFQENLEKANKARVLIDFVIDEHKGLSFRAFEALGRKQKLITTNSQIKYYDFYHPNNHLIWDGTNFDIIDNFLDKPYFDIDESIRKKYSFGNWINYILQIYPYQSIDLPK